MTEIRPRKLAGRLIVLFDGSSGSQSALLYGLAMARSQQREVLALYLHERALSVSCEFENSIEIGAISGQLRSVDTGTNRTRQAVRVQRVRDCLDHLARTAGVVPDLEERAGSPLPILTELLEPADWLVIGRSGYGGYQPVRPGRLARQLIEKTNFPLLLTAPGNGPLPGAVAVVLEAGRPAAALAELALAHAQASQRGLVALIDPELDECSGTVSQLEKAGALVVTTRMPGLLNFLRLCQEHAIAELVLDRRGAMLARVLREDWLHSLSQALLMFSPR